MAQRVQVLLTDDIDGTDADQTVKFGLDGVEYEIDLNSVNADKLRDTMSEWTNAGRRVAGRKQQAKRNTPRADLNEIRDWARANGYNIGDRGRVSAEIQQAYDNRNA